MHTRTMDSPHHVLASAVELLDGPHGSVSVGHVSDCADARLEAGRVHVTGHGDNDLHIVRNRTRLELRLGLRME
jgi:hypothetical protein